MDGRKKVSGLPNALASACNVLFRGVPVPHFLSLNRLVLEILAYLSGFFSFKS